MRIHSIFESISGEAGSFPQGTWCTFIRLQGCNLRCRWCDTPSAQDKEKGYFLAIEDILRKIQCEHVLITGGEPLVQKEELCNLLEMLVERGYRVQVETNGSIEPPIIEFSEVGWVLDYKLCSSGMTSAMLPLNRFATMLVSSPSNYLKFVVSDKEDLTQLIRICKRLRRLLGHEKFFFVDPVRNGNPFLISPVGAKGDFIPSMVKQIEKEFPELLDMVTFSVQMHKLLDLP
jgi:7-carboxy-7-deazaguanine synthase